MRYDYEAEGWSPLYSFSSSDPDICLPRGVVVEILNSLEMWADVVQVHARRDEALDKVIGTVREALEQR